MLGATLVLLFVERERGDENTKARGSVVEASATLSPNRTGA